MDGDDYQETAEFHGLFMTEVWSGLRSVIGQELGHLDADDRIADLGAGTGLGSVALVEETRAQVWAVEPSTTMRAVLLHRVASSPEASPRVSVAAGSIPDALDSVPVPVAAIVATHVLGHLGPKDTSALFAWIATALAPGGVALFTYQPAGLEDATDDEVPEQVAIGRHIYRATYRRAGEGYRTTYEVLDGDGEVVRSVIVSGTWSIVTYVDIAAAAEGCGLDCRQLAEGVAVVSRPARGS